MLGEGSPVSTILPLALVTVAKTPTLPRALEALQCAVGLGLGGLGSQEIQIAISGILVGFRVPAFPVQFEEPVAQLDIISAMRPESASVKLG